jgi:hypothetical protein
MVVSELDVIPKAGERNITLCEMFFWKPEKSTIKCIATMFEPNRPLGLCAMVV